MTQSQSEKASRFAALHVPGDPLVLWNIWDAGSARAVVNAGAPAVATGSWSVATSLGREDGEDLPIAEALRVAGEIARAVDVPVTVDFEGGYSTQPDEVAENVAALEKAGAVGLNIEDRVIGGSGLHPLADQVAKIAAVRKRCPDIFIHARTDVFLAGVAKDAASGVDEVIRRAHAYAEAGASGLFVPSLLDLQALDEIARSQPLPMGVLRMGRDAPSVEALAGTGAARVSHGPDPYRAMLRWISEAAAV